jgi:hypothetical protein
VRGNDAHSDENPRQTLKTQIKFRIFPPAALRARARKSAARD